MDNCFTRFPISDRSFVAYAKREVHNLVGQTSFDPRRVAGIDIIVSEMCSNLVKHGGGGELLFRLNLFQCWEIELLAIDNGPGIQDTAKAMKDGNSTTSTLGQGLGAMARLSDHFDIFSQPGWGTVVYCKVQETRITQPSRFRSDKLNVVSFCLPKMHETACGDGVATRQSGGELQVFLGDGLGHGAAAHAAVKTAADFFEKCDESDPVSILRAMHHHVRSSRGLVATIASLNTKTMSWQICGVGNIATRIYRGSEYRNYLSYNGTVGLNIPTTLVSSTVEAEKNQRLIMCSDGIRSAWRFNRLTGFARMDNTMQAAIIYKDNSRQTDDVSVVIASINC